MQDDDNLCLCFHVSRRKVTQYIRTQKPSRASQLSECYGAGTGCGWCRVFLERLLESENPESEAFPEVADYAQSRAQYRKHVGE
ncbi:MAG: (2Fe-2S)-binding protein [Planctomycetota bacterium]